MIKFLIPLLLIPLLSLAQKEIKVTDPDIAFTLNVPDKWQKSDDGYYLLISPPTSSGDEYLSVTYFETSFNSVKENFEGDIKHGFPKEISNFKLVETGEDNFGDTEALWAIYDSKEKGTDYRTLAYYFRQNGQLFKLKGQARKKKFEDIREDYVMIIRSLKSDKL